MFKTKIDRYLITDKGELHINKKKLWILDKPMSSLCSCHKERIAFGGHLVTSCYILINPNHREGTMPLLGGRSKCSTLSEAYILGVGVVWGLGVGGWGGLEASVRFFNVDIMM